MLRDNTKKTLYYFYLLFQHLWHCSIAAMATVNLAEDVDHVEKRPALTAVLSYTRSPNCRRQTAGAA